MRGAPRLVAGAPRCSEVHPKFSPVLRGVPTLITVTPMVLLYQLSEISVTLKAGRNALLGSDTLLKLTHLCLHSTSSQTLWSLPVTKIHFADVERLASMISSWTSSIALLQLIAWLDRSPGPSLMTFIQFVMYSAVRSSVGWKPVVAEVLNLLVNLIDSASSILSLKLTSCICCVSCMSCMSCVSCVSCMWCMSCV